MTTPVPEAERSGREGVAGRRGASAAGPLPQAAEDKPVMPPDTPLAPAVRSETAAPYAARAGAPPPCAETLLARIERAGPAALDDHELLGLVGIHVDAATLDAAGGLREFFNIACLAVDGWPDILWEGTSFPQLRTMMTACRTN